MKVCQSLYSYLLENQLPQKAHSRDDELLQGQSWAEERQASSSWDSSSLYLVRPFLLTPAAADSCCKARTKGPYINGSLSCNLEGNSLRRFRMQDMTLVTPQCIQRLAPINLFIREHSCSLSAVTPSAYSLSRDGAGESQILTWGNSPKKQCFQVLSVLLFQPKTHRALATCWERTVLFFTIANGIL